MKIIADTHFGHTNILLYEPIRIQKARMEGYEDFDEFLIDWLNLYINENEEILHLGDVAFKEGYKLVEKLNGKFTLIKGNHDKQKHLNFYKNLGWKIIDTQYFEDTPLFKYDKRIYNYLKKFGEKALNNTACLIKKIKGKKILFSHYPVFNDNSYDKIKYKKNQELLQYLYQQFSCDINIHGHTHSYVVNDKRCINACLEINDFKPIKI